VILFVVCICIVCVRKCGVWCVFMACGVMFVVL